MGKKAFDRIAEGLNEALAFARGDLKGVKLFVPPEIDVRAIRKNLGMTQDSFAQTFGFTLAQIRDWEQGRSRPLDALRAYLMIIDAEPKRVMDMIQGLAKTRGKRKAA